MRRRLWLGLGVFALSLGMTAASSAQGTITDGNAIFRFNAGTTPGSLDYLPDGTTDHAFQNWWWFRIAGDPNETSFPWPPPQQNYSGNTATMRWNFPQFEAVLTITLHDGAPGQATASESLAIRNNSTSALTIDLFNYVDFDLMGTFSDDSATLLAPDRIGISDPAGKRAEFYGPGSIAYQVDDFPVIRDLLDDAVVTNLNNTGLPFGPADFTGAMQWQFQQIPPGEVRVVTEVLAINEPAKAWSTIQLFGNCPGPMQIVLSGNKGGTDVGVLASLNNGPFVIPPGVVCGGTVMGVQPPFQGGTPTQFVTNPLGVVVLNVNMPPAACGNLFIQAIDLANCRPSNIVVP